jgi:hypothetical protein
MANAQEQNQGDLIPASELFTKMDWRRSIEDFTQTYPNIPAEELKMFRNEYEFTIEGTFLGWKEMRYSVFYNSGLRYQYEHEELKNRLMLLREGVRMADSVNANPDRERDYTYEDIIRRDQRIQNLFKKCRERTATDDERSWLKTICCIDVQHC